MKNKRILHTFITALILALAVLSSACSDDRTAGLSLSPQESIFGPGLTTELVLSVSFIDPDSNEISFNPGRTNLKTFAETPSVTISNPNIRLLSIDTKLDDSAVEAKIIVRASDAMLSGTSAEINTEWGGCSAGAILWIRKNPADYIDADGVVTDPAAYDVLVNKQRRLPAGYIPVDLVRVEVPTILVFEEVNHLRQAASEALSAMFAAAEAEQGYKLLARSGYRSYNTQVMLYELNVREYGEEYAKRISARPGTSEHQSGLAMDISSPVVNYQLTEDFGDTDEGKWAAENAHRFGFILRYLKTKEDVTGYTYEPWHLRWVGTELAAEVYNSGLTLEEFFSN
ncbi:MAG TPA: hypothetical protein DCO79_11090 [Spirochaeta sp.]|nr:hypothetical protein [Spirochaeta sp.]